MSDDYLRLIPTDPEFVPDCLRREKAQGLLASYLPLADGIEAQLFETVKFIDQGSNFERVSCPACLAKLDVSWWGSAMNSSYKSDFADLRVTVPCCGTRLSLNDLRYEWPAGFARFVLQALNPGDRLTEIQVKSLEDALACSLRVIWAHY